MMRRILVAGAVAAAICAQPVCAQQSAPVTIILGGTPVSGSNPLPVNATVTASVSGFAPSGHWANLTATASSADVALPTNTGSILVYNTGTTAVSCGLTVGAGSAVANQDIIQASSATGFAVGSNTHISCIDQTGSASNLVVISGGSGLPTGWGGGGGGSGGTVNQGTQGSSGSPWFVNVTNANANGQATMANSSPVAIASNQSAIPVTQSGSWTGVGVTGTFWPYSLGQTTMSASVPVAIASNQAAIPVNLAASTTGGCTPYTPFVPTAGDNHQTVKNGAGTVCAIQISNNSATKNYARLYDAGTGFNGCNSATGVIFAFEIPPTDSGFSIPVGGANGMSFSTGLSLCITSGFGLTDTTAATATAMYVNVQYK